MYISKRPIEARTAPPAPVECVPCTRAAQPWVLAATILGSAMAFIDGTVVNVALPTLQRDLNATVADVQWFVESYTLLLAALLLVGGALGDRYGRRLVYAIGIGLFALASAWCGLANTPMQLIVARALQGVGAALLVPGSLAIISASFVPEERGKAVGTWSGFSAMTTALGPVLGGLIIDTLSWRWVFYINVPIAIVVLVLLFWHVPESKASRTSGPLDWGGALLATIGLGSLIYGLIEGGLHGFGSPLILAALAVGVLALAAFVVVERRVAEPIMPLWLFRSRTFSGANLLTLLLYFALGGALFFLPFNLIQVQGYTTTQAGSALLPFVLLIFLLSRWAGGLVTRFGARRPLMIGPVIVAAGFGLFALPGIGGSYWTTFFPAITVMGLGMAISVVPLTTIVMNSVDNEHVGTASGINNAMSRTAGLLAIAVLGIVMIAFFSPRLDSALAPLALPPAATEAIDAQRDRLAGIELPATLDEPARAAARQAINEAFVAGFRAVMIMAAVAALLSAVMAALLIEDQPQRSAPDDAPEPAPDETPPEPAPPTPAPPTPPTPTPPTPAPRA